MKLLILGASGFIGSNLVKFFTERPSYNISTAGTSDSSFNNPHFIFSKDKAEFDEIIRKTIPDVIINASGSPSVDFSLKRTSEDYRLNTYNTYLLLDSIRRNSINTKLIHLSSAAVYGNPIQLPVNENAALKPLSPYGFHKLQAENICTFYSSFYGLKTINLRIFSAYGEGLKKQLFWDILNKIQSGVKEIELSGSGNESRDFIHIDDLCKAIECVIKNADFLGEVINVGTGIETKISEAVHLFAKAIEASVQFKFTGKIHEGNPLNWCADISKLKKLGFQPDISFRNGISKTAKYLLRKNN